MAGGVSPHLDRRIRHQSEVRPADEWQLSCLHLPPPLPTPRLESFPTERRSWPSALRAGPPRPWPILLPAMCTSVGHLALPPSPLQSWTAVWPPLPAMRAFCASSLTIWQHECAGARLGPLIATATISHSKLWRLVCLILPLQHAHPRHRSRRPQVSPRPPARIHFLHCYCRMGYLTRHPRSHHPGTEQSLAPSLKLVSLLADSADPVPRLQTQT
mmetsp:Transcript_6908/g.19413  ORF Transcript_6908/g.19413 Transcript_6908/m.19413 type:complete len:215 (+) Transcript_6908:2933-3577(+)